MRIGGTIVTAERETPVTVLLERHLIDLQLQNAPEQYLISRVLARLMELESLLWAGAHSENFAVEVAYWRAMAGTVAGWIADGRQWRASITANEVLERANLEVTNKVVSDAI